MTGAEIVTTGIVHIVAAAVIFGGFIVALICIFSFREDK